MKSRHLYILAFLVSCCLFIFFPSGAAAQGPPVSPDYRAFPFVGSRIAIWVVAQLHLMLAAFVLGVPIFAVIVEYIGVRTKDPRYDLLAREFTKLLVYAFTITAIFGAILLFLLIGLYPQFFSYMADIFLPSMVIYVFLFFGETFSLYLYWYGWDRLMDHKRWHLGLGIALNLFGTALMVIANSWATFMMSPAGVNEAGSVISRWAAFTNPTWMPINIHRLIANVAFGGAIVGAYAAFRFLGAKTPEDKAHYDWMGYVGNFIAISAFIPLPFAGYWLGREIYAFNQQMGIELMGGFLSWLWIIQAVLIGVLFLTSNYYLWLALGKIEGAQRYRKYIKYLIAVLAVGFLVWATPHTLVASLEEARRVGAAYHPLLGVLGVMSAKNTVVNMMILTTFVSFMFYRRANKVETVSWAQWGKTAQKIIVALGAGIVIWFGVNGYYDLLGLYGPRGQATPAIIRIGFSVYQVLSVLFVLLAVTIIDLFLYRGAKSTGPITWGKMPVRSQYALFLLAITFTWLMGLMGFARSSARQHWHVFGIMRDTSPDAFTPSLGYAANIVSISVLLFLAFVFFVFWISHLGEKPAQRELAPPPPRESLMPAYQPEPLPGLPKGNSGEARGVQ